MGPEAIGKEVARLVRETDKKASKSKEAANYAELGAKVLELVNDPPVSQRPSSTKDVFPFEKLPPEIRNQIYGYALLANSDLEINRHRQYSPFWTKRIQRWEDDQKKGSMRPKPRSGMEVKVTGSSNRRRKAGPRFSITILLVNKQFLSEANQILYGSNTFYFTNALAFKFFAEEIGNNVKLLRDIEIQSFVLGKLTGVFENVGIRTRMSRLAIGVGEVLNGRQYGKADELVWMAIKDSVWSKPDAVHQTGCAGAACECGKLFRKRRFDLIKTSFDAGIVMDRDLNARRRWQLQKEEYSTPEVKSTFKKALVQRFEDVELGKAKAGSAW